MNCSQHADIQRDISECTIGKLYMNELSVVKVVTNSYNYHLYGVELAGQLYNICESSGKYAST
jgi:hypothetical protein